MDDLFNLPENLQPAVDQKEREDVCKKCLKVLKCTLHLDKIYKKVSLWLAHDYTINPQFSPTCEYWITSCLRAQSQIESEGKFDPMLLLSPMDTAMFESFDNTDEPNDPKFVEYVQRNSKQLQQDIVYSIIDFCVKELEPLRPLRSYNNFENTIIQMLQNLKK